MANRKITELNALTGANATDTDVFAIVDISADETKKMTLGELKEAFDTGSGFVRITGDTMTGDLTVPNVVVSGNVDGRDVSADGTKLDGIEAGATADQTAAEIRSLVESATDSNVFTDADHSKLNGIEAGATADQTAAEIKTAYESNANTNEFSDAEQTKLAGIEAGADVTDTANVTSAGALMDSELTDIAAVKALNQGVATTDGPTFTNTQLSALAATISDTAVDVFVYDTSKDSDGGAWRKRTQGTSWYNETLNTATRGSRKEFPAVAVIVAHGNDVTIYDGDDPDLPMWMHFEGNYYLIAEGNISSVFALNGKLVTGCNGYDAYSCDFLEDVAYEYSDSSTRRYGNISLRNTTGVYNVNRVTISSNGIVNRTVNDVAMTVLPNAPIDAATGLPVPTIAVATDGGVSVIKDDGTVIDILNDSGASYAAAVDIIFTKNNQIRASHENGVRMVKTYNIPTSDISVDNWNVDSDDGTTFWYTSTAGSGSYGDLRHLNSSGVTILAENALASSSGLTLVDENLAAPAKGMIAYTTSDYATGWMNGDIKLATLSDTDDTDVTGAELVTNGTFDTDTSGWTAVNDAVLSVDTNRLKVTNNVTDYGSAHQDITTVAGETYVVTFDFELGTSSRGRLAISATGGAVISAENYTADGSYNATFVATTASTRIQFINNETTDASHCLFDNISVRLAEEDRSVNGNGLQVFGTVTKNPVATGADLVAYSGFSGSNYLEQPYNSDLDFGTGDFCLMGWVKRASGTYATGVLLGRKDSSNTDGYVIFTDASNNINFYTREGSANSTLTSSFNVSDGVWHHITAVRTSSGTVQALYIDGRLVQSASVTARNVSNSTAKCRLGLEAENTLAPFTSGSLALWRISATAPSPEQIKKIYEDEKVLFQENAQATLYGSSDAVTALAYDDSTNILSVGTSAGRSDFQGLRRVNNTTNAVGAAISASNGMIVEE